MNIINIVNNIFNIVINIINIFNLTEMVINLGEDVLKWDKDNGVFIVVYGNNIVSKIINILDGIVIVISSDVINGS